MSYELPDLPYDYNALEPYIDAKTMEVHHDKHHAGYVDKLNKALEGHDELQEKDIVDLLKQIDVVPDEIKQNVINNGGGHANHSLFWEILSSNSEIGKFKEVIEEKFGSFEEFKTKFKEKALNRFGSGWVWLVVDNGELNIIDTMNQDSPFMIGFIPILGLDVWEHAYYLKYQNKRADYIDAFWNVVNWEKVEELYNQALEDVRTL